MSQFISDPADYDDRSSSRIDFVKATLLKGSGSTCDIYKTRWQRRTVFVKRLKKEYRDSPLHLDALEKEFEVGVGLTHPSLPTYLAFSRDYIVLDFIDGMTLADMLKTNDPWLKEEKNRRLVLRQLIEAVEYLHRHNIVHCDIKADNIMITANGNNLVLLDFDKCYTDYFNDTSGHPGRYEMDADNPGRMTMDWRGVANIAEKLESFGGGKNKYGKLVAACLQDEVNTEDLKRLIDGKAVSHGKLYLLLAVCSLAIVTLGYVFLGYDSSADPAEDTTADVQLEKIVVHPEKEYRDSINHDSEKKLESQINHEPVSVSREQVALEAKREADILEPLIEPYFSKLRKRLAAIATLKNKVGFSKEQLIDSLQAFTDMEDEYITESFEILHETFPGVSEREAWRIMSSTKSYPSYKRWADPLQIKLVEASREN